MNYDAVEVDWWSRCLTNYYISLDGREHEEGGLKNSFWRQTSTLLSWARRTTASGAQTWAEVA